MKTSILFTLFIFTAFIFSEEEFSYPWHNESYDPEIELTQNLIEITQENLHDQKQLLESILKFKETQKLFLNDTTNKQLASLMIEHASEALFFIEENSLHHIYSSDFLKEVLFFSKFNSVTDIARP